jgi:tetrahydromethanopterin S-methyltransferase subunit C
VSVAGGLILAALGVVFMRERNTWFLALLSRPFVWMPVAAMSLVAAAAVAVLWLDVNESVRSLAEEGIGTGAVGVGVYAMGAGAVASFAAALLMRSVEPRRIGGRLAWRSTVAS